MMCMHNLIQTNLICCELIRIAACIEGPQGGREGTGESERVDREAWHAQRRPEGDAAVEQERQS